MSTLGGACDTYWKPGGFVRSGELWCPEACPEACVYSRRSLQYLLGARWALFAPESCGARRRARRRVCTPGGACNTYWKPGALFAPESCGARRRARRRVCTPGGTCSAHWKPGCFVRSGGLWLARRSVWSPRSGNTAAITRIAAMTYTT